MLIDYICMNIFSKITIYLKMIQYKVTLNVKLRRKTKLKLKLKRKYKWIKMLKTALIENIFQLQ